MRTALTGGGGFVGSHLAEALRAGGQEVTALVRSDADEACLRALGFRCVRGGLEDDGALGALVWPGGVALA